MKFIRGLGWAYKTEGGKNPKVNSAAKRQLLGVILTTEQQMKLSLQSRISQ